MYHRYKVEFKKIEFLVGRALAKAVIGKCLGKSPETIHFRKNPYGKLYINDQPGCKKGHSLQFNIAHSQNMVVCAVTLEDEIGVDVEKVEGPIVDIVNRFFAAGEKVYLSQHPSEKQNKIAYQLWTLKEAFVKAKGVGLSLSLDNFDVTLLRQNIFLKCFEPKPDYSLAIAVAGRGSLGYQTKVMEVKNLSDLDGAANC